MDYDILKSVSQGSDGAQDAENSRIEAISDELKRRCQLHETQFGNSESNVSINNSNYNPYYLGVIAGVGARYNIDFKGFILVTKLDVVLNWGLLDTFSHSEHEGTSTPTNVNAYQHQGERYSRGVEVSLSLGFIRKHDMSACRGF